MKDTSKNMLAMEMLDKQLKSVHELFSKSGKRQNQWKRFVKDFGVTAFQFPVHNTTRWFSRAQCVKVLATNLPVLIAFLKRKRNRSGWEPAAALYDNLTDLTFVVLLHAVHDVLKPVEQFRLYFERDGNLPHKIPKQLNACKATLDELVGVADSKMVGGSGVQKLLKCVSKRNVWMPRDKPGIRIQLQSPTDFSLEVAREFLAELIGEVKGNLDDRFPDLDILSAFHIFDPRSYSDVKQSQLDAFGSADYKKLLKHFDGQGQAHRLLRLTWLRWL